LALSAKNIFNAIVTQTPIVIEPERAFDPVAACIAFDEGGFETEEEAVEFGRWLVSSGMVNSTGTFQRFVRDLYGAGLLP
jgi:hypothetical protein